MFSHLSFAGKMALLLGLLVSFLLFSTLLGLLLLVPLAGPGAMNIMISPDFNDPVVVSGLKIVQITSMAFGLLLPSLLYLYMTQPRPLDAMSNRISRPAFIFLITSLFMLSAQPVISLFNEWNSRMILPESLSGLENWMKSSEDQAGKITEAFLSTSSWSGFLVNTFMIALLPAFSEELLFRGILAKLLRDWTRNIHIGVILSALVFAGIHLQFYGFLPRFMLGVAFGYLFFRTGTLWVPIIAHFVNNFLSVLIEFLYRKGLVSVNADQFGMSDNPLWLIAGLVLTGCSLYLLLGNSSLRLKKEKS